MTIEDPSLALRHALANSTEDLRQCRLALREGSKTFLAASMLLPRAVSEPAAALYAFCRLADDAVDATDGPHGAVERLRERLASAYAGTPQDHPADRSLAVVVARHGIPEGLFDALLEGFVWDVQGRRYETFDELLDYAARVAGTVGAMMALLMGIRSEEGLARACDLGVAMQLSNIARDVGEDARMGRLYLPRQWLRDAGVDADTWLADPVFTPAVGSVVQRLLTHADQLYERVGAGVAALPVSCRPGINAARFLYAAIGHEVARADLDSVSRRARVSARRKAVLLLRSMVQVAPRRAAPVLPPLAATRFLVDAGLRGRPANWAAERRGLGERLVWAAELFVRLDQQTPVSVAQRLA
jgi:phytoene synthase